ncbi:hypothetical protein [Pseudoxanthomonas winnipegensis]|uniref:Uncharacterized protein n=1 Tax=Pseudoxanthomonas winnipegensis TaxID=2480810 RepID=A0A4Q8LQN6_9GAMM|nr:hypothetical protein [Pseudoxanthomonas winnipegensis]RZZ89704.1 hypothetical protein EA662_04880 [Pseudoxanthomonas winnipegensis]TAA32870.1 hypothetical protein EA661_00880 [Pseudoxanthomonas winnipegensis]TAA43114.1 hypothetical protein EAT51_05385 [Pseudoxanthomonas winnipegensis]TBV78647.1 hypothetical protein EYC46_01785 [Pseudoxanthomonas winnipegensis]
MDTVEHLSYSPPKSIGFGHAPTKRNVFDAWDMTQRFLTRNTQGALRTDILVEAVGPSGYAGEKMKFPSQERALATFGAPEKSEGHWCRWRIGIEDVPKAFELFSYAHASHQRKVSSFRFCITQDFRWRGIDDTTIAGSYLGINFDDFNGMFFQPAYVFPFAFDAQEHRPWLQALMKDSPFKLREPYFKRALQTKAGNSYRALKLDKNWLTNAPDA